MRRGALRWWRDWRPQRWVDVGVALEQSTGADGRRDSIFFVFYTQYDEKKVGPRPCRALQRLFCARVRVCCPTLMTQKGWLSFSTFRCF